MVAGLASYGRRRGLPSAAPPGLECRTSLVSGDRAEGASYGRSAFRGDLHDRTMLPHAAAGGIGGRRAAAPPRPPPFRPGPDLRRAVVGRVGLRVRAQQLLDFRATRSFIRDGSSIAPGS